MGKFRTILCTLLLSLTTLVMGQQQDMTIIRSKAAAGDAEAQFNLALEYGENSDWDNMFTWMEKAGEQGYEPAIKMLFAIYSRDYSVKSNRPVWEQLRKFENNEKAFYWIKKWAENGQIKQLAVLAAFYYLGTGVKENWEEAYAIYKKVVAMQPITEHDTLCIANAEAMLGTFYEGGKAGLEQSDEQAAYWYKRAAERKTNDNGTAAFQLAKLYLDGNGVKQDFDQAIYWFNVAKEKGHKEIDIWLSRAEQKKQQYLASANKPTVPEDNRLPALPSPIVSDNVDENIPHTHLTDDKTYAVIIGNENYENEADVPFAEHDAETFRQYAEYTLGIPSQHINFVTNAGLNKIRGLVRWLKEAMSIHKGQGKVIVYYAGHGIPDESNHSAYLLPVDGIGNDVESAYPLDKFYKELGDMPAERIIVFLDACFSGAKREGDMMASARGVAIKVKDSAPKGNMIVFTAAQGDETAYPYKQQKHGMFTYYLLSKLQKTQGDATLGDLSDYLIKEVKRQSFVENNKLQTPTVIPSQALMNNWQTMKLK